MSNDGRWIDRIVGTLFCPTCGAVYGRDDLILDGPRGVQVNLTCICHVCARRTVAILVSESPRVVAAEGPVLTIDDVLEAHRMLGKYDGDLNGLFAHPAR